MEQISQLINISNSVNRRDIATDLAFLEKRLNSENKEIIIPLVGEFSSGKTSIINSLMDNNKLETASKATTATIFEIYFGKDKSYAEVIQNNSVEVFENIEDIKNSEVSEKEVVRIYDTSTKVPASTIIVDTPGLSSSDVRHKLALTSYLPNSDAIFLVIDINQQITRSLLDFVDTTKISGKPIYLIINKCDTKTQQEVEEVKEYIAKEIKLSINNVVCISTKNNDLRELYELLNEIQKDKNTIVNNAINVRVKNIKETLSIYISELMNNMSSDNSLDEIIYEQKLKLEKINNNINKLISDAEEEIVDKNKEYEILFNKNVSEKLENIVANRGNNMENEVFSTVNQTSQIILNNYEQDIKSILSRLARERKTGVDSVPLEILDNLNISNTVFNYSDVENLSNIGHEYDDDIVSFIDIATLLPMAKKKLAEKGVKVLLKKWGGKLLQHTGGKLLQKIVDVNIIKTGVDWVTEQLMGKPQRKKAIQDYIQTSLVPEFKRQLDSLKEDVVAIIGELLKTEAQHNTSQIEKELEALINQKKTEGEAFQKKIEEFQEYIKFLNAA